MSDNELCLKEIGQRIIERRKKLGLTQEALAEKGEVTTQFVSYLVQIYRSISFETGLNGTALMPFSVRKKFSG